MKKRSSKIIFASLGALTSISAISVGLVSCGKNTTTPTDKPIALSGFTDPTYPKANDLTPATLIFSSAKLEIPFQTELVHHLPVGTLWSLSDIIATNITTTKDTSKSSANLLAVVTIAGVEKQVTAKVTYDFSKKQYNINDLKVNWAPISDLTPAKAVFGSAALQAPLTSAIKAMPKYSETKFSITNIVANDIRKNDAKAEMTARVYAILITDQGQQKIETNVFYHTSSKNYNFFDISISEFTPLSPKWDTPTQAGNPFDQEWHEYQSDKPVNKKLHDAIKTAEQKNGYGELYNYNINSKITSSKDMKTAFAIYHGHANGDLKPHESDVQKPFDLKITYNYANETYSWSNFKSSPSYKEVLSKDNLKTPVNNAIINHLKVDSNTLSNVDFNTIAFPSYDKADHPYIKLAGIYTLKNLENRFTLTMTYDYATKTYTDSKWAVSTDIGSHFSVAKTNSGSYVNPELYNALNKTLKKQGWDSKVAYNLVATTKVNFPGNHNYNAPVINMIFKGTATEKTDPNITFASFTVKISYHLSPNSLGPAYFTNDLVINPASYTALEDANLTPVITSSLQQIDDASPNNISLINFTCGQKPAVSTKTPTQIQVKITGKALMNRVNIKSFSATITYDFATKKYSASEVKVSNTFNPFIRETIAPAMQIILAKNNPNSKISGVTVNGINAVKRDNNVISTWISYNYFKDGSKTQITESGTLKYNLITATYSFIADK